MEDKSIRLAHATTSECSARPDLNLVATPGHRSGLDCILIISLHMICAVNDIYKILFRARTTVFGYNQA